MSLVCGEHGHFFVTTDELYAVTTESSPQFSAVCAETIRAIPPDLISRGQLEGGLDIYLAYSKPYGVPGFERNLTFSDLSLDDYKFSISADTARKYLPASSAQYL